MAKRKQSRRANLDTQSNHAVPQPSWELETGTSDAKARSNARVFCQFIRQRCHEGNDRNPAQWGSVERSAPIELFRAGYAEISATSSSARCKYIAIAVKPSASARAMQRSKSCFNRPSVAPRAGLSVSVSSSTIFVLAKQHKRSRWLQQPRDGRRFKYSVSAARHSTRSAKAFEQIHDMAIIESAFE